MFIIAVDGPAGAGKGSIARSIAHHFNLKHIDTGLMYRALAFKSKEMGIDATNIDHLYTVAQTLSTSDLEHPFLKLEETGARASQIAVHSVIRDTLNSHIRVLCRHIQRPYSGAVLDGRDIGTVVYPDADVKFFITASEDVRAQRRAKELSMRDTTQSYESILTHIQERDMRDRSRSVAPLTASADAYSIDTTLLTLDQACETVLDIVKRHVLNAMPAALTS